MVPSAMPEKRLSSLHSLLFASLGLLALAPAGSSASVAEPPRIGKPRPAPDTPPDVPPLPPAFFDPSLAVGGEDVKARKVETRLTVQVRVNDFGPYQFIVDSGADTSVVGLRIARDLQLPLGTPAILNGMTGRKLVERVKVGRLSLGSTHISNLQLPALRESDLGGDGIIGIDALHQQRLLLDFDKRLIKVEDAHRPSSFRSLPGEIVVIARRRRGQLILTQVRAAGLPVQAVIDTGSQVTIGNLALRDKLLRRNPDKFLTVSVTDVTGGTQKLQMAKIGQLELGPVQLEDVPMAFADVPPFKLFGLEGKPAILLGTDLLESFGRVALDFRARRVRFQLRRCRTEGIIVSTSPTSFTRMFSNGAADVCGRG